jgi:hypothetical protein
MARQWWDTADGPDNGQRERARVLRAVADGALAGAGTVNVDNLPPAAVDALVGSESLRDFGNDRVAFRHDVLAEWAVSCLLSDLALFDRLPLQSPASAILAPARAPDWPDRGAECAPLPRRAPNTRLRKDYRSNAFFQRFFGSSNFTVAESNASGSNCPPAHRSVDSCSS